MGVSIERVREWVVETTEAMTGDVGEYQCPYAVLVPYEVAMRGAVKEADRWGDTSWNRFCNGPDDEFDEPATPTHYIRFVYDGGVDLVDGDDWWVRIDGDEIELLTVPDHPAFNGGYLSDAIKWCKEPESWV